MFNKSQAVGKTEDVSPLVQAITEACNKARAANECGVCCLIKPAAANGPQLFGSFPGGGWSTGLESPEKTLVST